MIFGMLGSGSDESLCRQGLMAVAEQVRAKGMQFDLIDLKCDFRELHHAAVYSNPQLTARRLDFDCASRALSASCSRRLSITAASAVF